MQKNRGFTLIELMIAIVIIAILAAIAWPSYQNTVRSSNRTEARAELMDLAQRFQKCFTAYGRFNNDNCPVFGLLNDAGDVIVTETKGFYEISGNITATTFTLTATAIIQPQLGDTGCEVMTITHTGVRAPEGCW